MKKFISIAAFLVIVSLGFALVTSAHAGPLAKAVQDLRDLNTKLELTADLPGVLGTIIRVILSFVGTIFLILTIYAGIMWMTAQGEEEKIEKSKKIIQAAIIGLIIVLSAYTITVFVADRLGGATAPSPAPSATGCCMAKDKKMCAENVAAAACDIQKADWSQGACPVVPGVQCVKN